MEAKCAGCAKHRRVEAAGERVMARRASDTDPTSSPWGGSETAHASHLLGPADPWYSIGEGEKIIVVRAPVRWLALARMTAER